MKVKKKRSGGSPPSPDSRSSDPNWVRVESYGHGFEGRTEYARIVGGGRRHISLQFGNQEIGSEQGVLHFCLKTGLWLASKNGNWTSGWGIPTDEISRVKKMTWVKGQLDQSVPPDLYNKRPTQKTAKRLKVKVRK